jgi:hypothetical protein
MSKPSSKRRWSHRLIVRCVLLLGVLLASPAISFSDTVHFPIDPGNIGTAFAGKSVDLFSAGLNGTLLTGQKLSLDLIFSNKVLAKLFLSYPEAFGIELIVHTNAGTFPGFAGLTTGYLLDRNGKRYGDIQSAGRADGSDGTLSVGLVSFTTDSLKSAKMIDISGVHFDTTVPDNGYVITGAYLRFSLNSVYDRIEFRTSGN